MSDAVEKSMVIPRLGVAARRIANPVTNFDGLITHERLREQRQSGRFTYKSNCPPGGDASSRNRRPADPHVTSNRNPPHGADGSGCGERRLRCSPEKGHPPTWITPKPTFPPRWRPTLRPLTGLRRPPSRPRPVRRRRSVPTRFCLHQTISRSTTLRRLVGRRRAPPLVDGVRVVGRAAVEQLESGEPQDDDDALSAAQSSDDDDRNDVELPEPMSEGRASAEAAEKALVRKPRIGDTMPIPTSPPPGPARASALPEMAATSQAATSGVAAVAAADPVASTGDGGLDSRSGSARSDQGGSETGSKKSRRARGRGKGRADDGQLDDAMLEQRRGRERNGKPIGRYFMAVQVRPRHGAGGRPRGPQSDRALRQSSGRRRQPDPRQHLCRAASRTSCRAWRPRSSTSQRRRTQCSTAATCSTTPRTSTSAARTRVSKTS